MVNRRKYVPSLKLLAHWFHQQTRLAEWLKTADSGAADENYQPTVHAVAVDTVGAGNGEIVIITTAVRRV